MKSRLFTALAVVAAACQINAQTPEYRGIWVDAWGNGFLTASQVTTLVNHCRTYNFNSVVVQMRRRGDAFYMPQAPNLEPRTTAIASNFDALQEIINQCHSGSPRIEVHCWTPTFLVGDSSSPSKPTHVMNVHPEYLLKDSAGETFIGEGYYLDPGNPDAQMWNYNMAKDIVSRYDIDGFHWDYIRYPTTDSGYNETAIARYNAEYGLTGQPTPTDNQFENWRRRQVTDFLRWVNADLLAIKTNLIISCSVFGSRSDAYNARFQDWSAWNSEGIIDICMPMGYTDNNSLFQSRVDDAFNNQGVRRVYAGMGAYLNTKENTVFQLDYIRNKGFFGSMVYSYRVPNVGTVNQTATFTHIRDNHQPTWVNTPTIPWKTTPTKGIAKGTITQQGGAAIYNATVVISTSPNRTLKSEGHGKYAFFETTPGTYTLTASAPGLGSLVSNVTVTAGGIAAVDFVFPPDSVPPVISSVASDSVTDTSATILWTTDESADSVVEYGPTISYGTSVTNSSAVTSHSMALSGLSPSTTHHFRVKSKDALNNQSTSGDFTFLTNPSGVVNDTIVESRTSTGGLTGNPPYSESGFADSTLKSSAPGLSGSGSRYAASGTPAYTLTPTLPVAGGSYAVYLTHGNATSISDDVVVSVNLSGGTGLPSTTTIFRESGGNSWELLGTMALNPGVSVPALTFTRSSGVLSGSARMYSDAAKFVFVPTPPSITSQPSNQFKNYSSNATFTVTVAGTTPLSYQWRKGVSPLSNGGRISGANSSALTIAEVIPSDAGSYNVVVTNIAGAATSSSATLTVVDPAIVTQPASQTNDLNGIAIFNVSAVGTPLLSYQWKKDGIDLSEGGRISGSTSPSLTINNLQFSDADDYTVVVDNSSGSVTSIVAVLGVDAAPGITSQPNSITNNQGDTATFTASVVGASPLTYQWRKNAVNLNNGGNVSGASSLTLTLSNIGSSDAANYTLVITNSFGSETSQVASLTVVLPPSVTTDPSNSTNRGGSIATFTVAASGTAPFSYQWRKNGVDLSNDGNISGATSATLTVSNVTQADAANYSVLVSNDAGNDTSGSASLIVYDGGVAIFEDDFETGNLSKWTQSSVTGGTMPIISTARNAVPGGGTYSAEQDNEVDRMHRNIIADNGGVELGGAFRATWYLYDDGVTTPRVYAEMDDYTGTGRANGSTSIGGAISHVVAAGKYTSLTLAGETHRSTNYQARVSWSAGANLWFNLNGGNNVPESGVPNPALRRSVGWHKFEVERYGTTYRIYVDGVVGRTITNSTAAGTFDTLTVGFGSGSAPLSAWWDGFKVENLSGAPVFAVPPQSISTNIGADISFTATVTGSGPITYQWKKGMDNLSDGGNISGANTATLMVSGVSLDDVGNYTLVASNSGGSTTSSAATLSVEDEPPAIITQPASRTNSAESVATFTVSASGTSLTYQWRRNTIALTDDGKISGATTSTLTINDVSQADAANYSVVVSNSANFVTSSDAVLTVITAPSITLDPTSTNRNAGQSVTFITTASGTAPLTYQWKKNGLNLADGGNISGSATASLTINGLLAADSGSYSVLISNSAGDDTSAEAVLTVNDPFIASQPASRTNAVATTATFTVAALGTEALTYQWKKGETDLSNGGNVSGATASTLILSNVQASDATNYSVVVTSEAGGVVASSNAVLTVVAALDFVDPSVSILSPKNNSKTNVAMVTLSGTAKDPGGVVVGVKYRLLPETNFASATLSSAGTLTNWVTPSVTLLPGTNIVHAYSIDAGANESPIVTNKFYYNTTNGLLVKITGNGQVKNATVLNITNNQTFSNLVGRGYSLTAFIGKGTNYVFTNWTGGINIGSLSQVSTNPIYNFVMQSNLILQANFITNPFTPVAGTYAGLFYDTNNGMAHHSAGFVTVRVTEKAGFSCKLIFGGDTVSGSGKWNLFGQGGRTFSRLKKGKSDVTVSMELDLSGVAQQIRGTLTDGNWTSTLRADRATFSLTNPATAYVGRSTFLVPPTNYPANAPGGFGYGTVTNNVLGTITLAGGLGDGSRLAQRVSVSKDSLWPMYAQLYKTTNANLPLINKADYRGAVMGWLTFANGAPTGTVHWFKTGTATNYLYPAGFTNVVDLISSPYIPPAIGEKALDITAGEITFTYGDLSSPLAYDVNWSIKNVITLVTPPLIKPTFSLTAKSGLFKGTFAHPQLGNAKTNFTGAVLQDQNYVGGFFKGANQSGSMLLESTD